MQAGDITFTLDGRTVQGRPGETVLSVARRNGVRIPTLCFHESVTPYGVCRLCVVEVFWKKRSKLVTSCVYTPSEGDVVETNNARVRRARRMVLELLLARSPDAEVVRDLAHEYGADASRFPRPEGRPAVSDRCILCGLCVRVCDEVVGLAAIGFEGRGSARTVSTPFRANADDCIGCGACAFVCPTNALHFTDADGRRTANELNATIPLVNCRACGRPFATERQVALICERLGVPAEFAETCPACRGAVTTDIVGELLR